MVRKKSNYATKDDLDQVKRELKADIAVLKVDMATKDDLEEIKQKVNLLPTKDEFFTAMDKLMGEVQKEREENVLIGHRMKRIEKHFPQILASD